ncbi:MAG: hypothetical protein EXR62_15490 [Chloroflexi bacterium]|nr:hypothetical protein [Chloroflexota bacterium]
MRGLILLVWSVVYLGGLVYLALLYLADHPYPPSWILFLAFALAALVYTGSMGLIIKPRKTDDQERQ